MKSRNSMTREGDWSNQAACLEEDPELFFPVGESVTAQRQTRQAQAVCEACPVRNPCLTFALNTNIAYGVWGGTAPMERARMKRRFEITSGRVGRPVTARVTRVPAG